METIKIRLNRKSMAIGMVLMIFMFLMMIFQLIIIGPAYEYFIGLVLFAFAAGYFYYKLKSFAPEIEINAFGYKHATKAVGMIMWNNVTDLRFAIIGRNTRVLEIRTKTRVDQIILAHVLIDPQELYDIFEKLSELPEEEREGFIRYVNQERLKRGVH